MTQPDNRPDVVDLKPCPCCASKNIVPPPKHWPEGCVYCRDCGLRAVSPEAWNSRPTQARVDAGAQGAYDAIASYTAHRDHCELSTGEHVGNFPRCDCGLDEALAALSAQPAMVAEAVREKCAKIAETPVAGEQDDITMEAKDRIAAAIRALDLSNSKAPEAQQGEG